MSSIFYYLVFTRLWLVTQTRFHGECGRTMITGWKLSLVLKKLCDYQNYNFISLVNYFFYYFVAHLSLPTAS